MASSLSNLWISVLVLRASSKSPLTFVRSSSVKSRFSLSTRSHRPRASVRDFFNCSCSSFRVFMLVLQFDYFNSVSDNLARLTVAGLVFGLIFGIGRRRRRLEIAIMLFAMRAGIVYLPNIFGVAIGLLGQYIFAFQPAHDDRVFLTVMLAGHAPEAILLEITGGAQPAGVLVGIGLGALDGDRACVNSCPAGDRGHAPYIQLFQELHILIVELPLAGFLHIEGIAPFLKRSEGFDHPIMLQARLRIQEELT